MSEEEIEKNYIYSIANTFKEIVKLIRIIFLYNHDGSRCRKIIATMPKDSLFVE